MYRQIPLIHEIFRTRDYDERCALIEAHLDEIDEEMVQAFHTLTNREDLAPAEQWMMANLCARTLSQVSIIHARRRNTRQADEFAEHSLEAFQQAFYMPGKLGLDDCKDMITSHLRLLLAFAGDLRAHGMEDRAWQAYWIADPIFAALDTISTIVDIPVAQLLEAAYLLEATGVPEVSEKLRKKARQQATSIAQFTREDELAKKLFTIPARLPDPDMYMGDTQETAIRFASQEVGVRCVQQTRCPRCHGPLRYESKALVGSVEGKVYDQYTLECEDNRRHPAVTLYKDVSKEPLMAGVAPELARLMQNVETEKKASRVAAPGVSTPSREAKRTHNLLNALFTIVLTVAISMLASLVAWGGFRLLGKIEGYWRVLAGNLGGSVAGFVVYMVVALPFGLLTAGKTRDGKPSGWGTGLAAVAGMAAGGYAGYYLAGLAGLVSLAVLLLLYLLLRRFTGRQA